MKNALFVSLAMLMLCATARGQEEIPQSTHPVWSPDGSQIAFINNHVGVENKNAVNFEVYTMNADGTSLKRHTNNTAFEAEITWSPDGQMLAFKSYRDGNDEVYVLELATGRQSNISNFSGRDGGPYWSSNNDILYFQSERDHEKGELYAFNLKTNKTKRITNNDLDENGAVWSPNGKQIAFVSSRDGDDDIYVINSSGKRLRQITNNPLNDWYPQWSPDGKQLIFTYGDWNTDVWETRVIDLNDKKEATLIKQVDSGNASWHPDGSRIAFASSKLGEGEVFLYDLKTKQEKRLTQKIRQK